MKVRTTIMLEEDLYNRVLSRLDKETISDFTHRAFLNQLEKDGDFEIRDLLEEEENAD